jgi:hypothetical protein
MSQPFFGIPDPGTPRPFKRSIQPGVIQGAVKGALRMVGPYSEEALRSAKRRGEELWRRGKRHPRTIGLVSGAVALTLIGAYALSATGAGSRCPAPSDRKMAFTLLMDEVPDAARGSKIDLHYDVCGLPEGTPYSGRVRLSNVRAKKEKPKYKPLLVTFKDTANGMSSRHEREVALDSVKAGAYNLELLVVDNRGRVRNKVQTVLIRAR